MFTLCVVERAVGQLQWGKSSEKTSKDRRIAFRTGEGSGLAKGVSDDYGLILVIKNYVGSPISSISAGYNSVSSKKCDLPTKKVVVTAEEIFKTGPISGNMLPSLLESDCITDSVPASDISLNWNEERKLVHFTLVFSWFHSHSQAIAGCCRGQVCFSDKTFHPDGKIFPGNIFIVFGLCKMLGSLHLKEDTYICISQRLTTSLCLN